MESSSGATVDPLPDNVPKILICADYFHPAFEAGGAARALTASVQALDSLFRQWVVTRNHDLGSRKAFSFLSKDDLRSDTESWTDFSRAKVWYVPSVWRAITRLPRLIRQIQPELVYLNSVFSPLSRAVLTWRRLGVKPAVPILLAPRGELAPAALSIKSTRKRAWIGIARAMGLLDDITWQASSKKEAAEIEAAFGRWRLAGRIVVIPEIVATPRTQATARRTKEAGSVRLCVLGRISPIKNIDGLLRALRTARGQFTVDAIGPAGDASYEASCRELESQLPSNVTWSWHGPLSPNLALLLLEKADVLAAPSHSENFGHAIAEALSRGIPAIVGTQTPWSDLAQSGAGWAVTSTDNDELKVALESACSLNGDAFTAMVDSARAYAEQRIVTTEAIDRLRDALLAVMRDHSSSDAFGLRSSNRAQSNR